MRILIKCALMRKIVSAAVSCTVFAVLLAVAVASAVPVYRRFMDGMGGRTRELALELESRSGLHFSYSSLSPSILTALSIKGIELSDSSGAPVMTIRRTRVSYSLKAVLSGDFRNSLRGISADGVQIDIPGAVSAYRRLTGSRSGFSLEKIGRAAGLLKSDISLRNVTLRYAEGGFSAGMYVRSADLSCSRDGSIGLGLDCRAEFSVPGHDGIISCGVSLDGVFPRGGENSSVKIGIRDLTDGEYSLAKQNFLVTYSGGTIRAETVQSVVPLRLRAEYSTSDPELDLSVRAENISLRSLFESSPRRGLSARLSGITADLSADARIGLSPFSVSYSSSGNVRVPRTLVPGGAAVSYSLSGDRAGIDIAEFSVTGDDVDASLSASCRFADLNISGSADIRRILLPNGNPLSAELYFDPMERGFMMFSPQVIVGGRQFTALQLTLAPSSDSYDFRFEVSDYSHNSDGGPGRIGLDGSFMDGFRYVQTGVSLDSLYLDSLVSSLSLFLPQGHQERISALASQLNTYLLTGDAYLSTDFANITYNVPYIMLADTAHDGRALLLSASGNGQSVQVERLNLILGGYALDLSASVDRMPGGRELFFSADITSSSIPYHLSGNILPGAVSVTGDYGLDVSVRSDGDGILSGSMKFTSLPLSAGRLVLLMSADMELRYSPQLGPEVTVSRLEVEETGMFYSISPRLTLSGTVTGYGAQFGSISYSDLYSSLEGRADLAVNMNSGVFSSAGLDFSVRSPFSDETISASAEVSNPGGTSFPLKSAADFLYVNARIQTGNFSLNRFTSVRNDSNVLSAAVEISGPVADPFVSVNVERAAVVMSGELMTVRGTGFMEDRTVSVPSLDFSYRNIGVRADSAEFSLDSMTGKISVSAAAEFAGKTISLPLELTVTDSVPGSGAVPDSFTAVLSSAGISGTLVRNSSPFTLTAVKGGDTVSVFSSGNSGFYGSVSAGGTVYASMSSDALSFEAAGSVSSGRLDVDVGGISADLRRIFSAVDLDRFISVKGGTVSGALNIGGTADEPDFSGHLDVSSPDIVLPALVPAGISGNSAGVDFIHNEIRVNDAVWYVKNSRRVRLAASVFLNKWRMDHVEVSVRSFRNELFPAVIRSGAVAIDGDVNCSLDVYYGDGILEVGGDVFAENVDMKTAVTRMGGQEHPAPKHSVLADLDVRLGTHVILNLDPLLRCVFVPDTSFRFKMDQAAQEFVIDGNLRLKSGDISYLNRSFYIKEGDIKFSPDDIFNPTITVRAETREKDDGGQTVRIILSAENQRLLDFRPRFSSVPAKSENEIRNLLGQIALADSESVGGFIFAASDYALQSTVVRGVENKLRDLLNFDILSLRTNILQNTLNMGMSGSFGSGKITVGNFLDNSTVYIGKYFGSALYVDAMLHLSYDKEIIDLTKPGALLFQPEFGFELESPFANIRWSMAPDINAMLNGMYVPSASLSLSWKFSF